MAGVPYIFGNATTSIPLTNLDANFNTGLTIGNTTVGLGNTVTTLGNVTIANATTISAAGNVFLATSSGSVGIGTSSPVQKLSVVSTGVNNTYIQVGADLTYSAGVQFAKSGTATGHIGSGVISGTVDTEMQVVSGNLRFYTNNTSERMRLDSSGNLLMGMASPAASFGSQSIQVSNASSVGQYAAGDGSSARSFTFGRDNITTGAWVFTYNGGLIASIAAGTGVYTPLSDLRLKKNITPLNYGLNEILKLNPVMYNMKTESDDTKKHIGLIAQETKSVIDESVDDLITLTQEMKDLGATEQYYGLDKSVLVPVLIKAIQELNATITTQSEQIAALQAKVGV